MCRLNWFDPICPVLPVFLGRVAAFNLLWRGGVARVAAASGPWPSERLSGRPHSGHRFRAVGSWFCPSPLLNSWPVREPRVLLRVLVVGFHRRCQRSQRRPSRCRRMMCSAPAAPRWPPPRRRLRRFCSLPEVMLPASLRRSRPRRRGRRWLINACADRRRVPAAVPVVNMVRRQPMA